MCGGEESYSFKKDDLFALLGRWHLDRGLKEVRDLAVGIPRGRIFQAEGEARAKTQDQKHFLDCLRASTRQFARRRLSKGVAGDEIREGPEGVALCRPQRA